MNLGSDTDRLEDRVDRDYTLYYFALVPRGKGFSKQQWTGTV